MDENTIICSHCGRQIPSNENSGNDTTPLCESCYEQHYTTCEHCGRLILYSNAYYERGDEDEDYPYCYDCYEQRRSSGGIHDYYYKPDPIFYGQGPRFFGVELEIDGAGESDSKANHVMEVGNEETEHIYCKHDGSLDDGFEIVSHPMSLDYHMNRMPWAEIIAKARELGYTSHQAGTCGLHVHVSRDAFGDTEAKQDEAIARVLYFFEKNWNELLNFSRRTRRQLDQWAARYGYKDQPRELLDQVKKGRANRYTAVNLTNEDTVEFRMFRGTLKLNTFLATLQLLDRICDVALYLSDDEIKGMSWSTFVSGCSAPELVQYLKERRLYVNEPVEGVGGEV